MSSTLYMTTMMINIKGMEGESLRGVWYGCCSIVGRNI